MQRNLKLLALLFCLVALAAVPSFAGAVSYTTLASFQSATTALTTQGFDSATVPTIIANGGGDGLGDGLTFTYSINAGAGKLEIVNMFPTTSPSNYLGSDDPATAAFFASDSLTITLPHEVKAFGLYIVGNGSYAAGTFTLSAAPGITQNSGTADVTIDAAGDVAYFVGLTSTTPFDAATIALTTPGGTADGPLWNVDDVTWGSLKSPVPEPGTLMLLGAGLVTAVRRARKIA